MDADEYEALLLEVTPEEVGARLGLCMETERDWSRADISAAVQSTKHGYPLVLQDITRELKLPAEEWEKRVSSAAYLAIGVAVYLAIGVLTTSPLFQMEALKRLRALAAGNSPTFEAFDDDIRNMEVQSRCHPLSLPPSSLENGTDDTGLQKQLVDCLADLRSQIVKEACLTVTQLARVLGNRFLTVADVLLETLFRQVGVHTKVGCDNEAGCV